MTQRRLLLVEDDLAFGRIVALILEDQVDVHCVGDADQALAALAEFEPDAIVSDMNMPRMSGVELYRKIQTNNSTRKIPFALMTGFTDDGDGPLQEARTEGIRQIISKDLGLDELRDTLLGLVNAC